MVWDHVQKILNFRSSVYYQKNDEHIPSAISTNPPHLGERCQETDLLFHYFKALMFRD